MGCLTWMKPSDAEAMRLLQEAVRQYEESMRIADFPDYLEEPEAFWPEYSRDTPMGLAVKRILRTGLVDLQNELATFDPKDRNAVCQSRNRFLSVIQKNQSGCSKSF